MAEPLTQRKTWDPAENKRGIECRYCGCKHFRVVYTRPTWGGRIMAPMRVPPLRQEDDHLGKGGRVMLRYLEVLVIEQLDRPLKRGNITFAPTSAWGSG